MSAAESFINKYTKGHRNLIVKALGEIDRLSYSMESAAKGSGKIEGKKRRWKEVAIPFPEKNNLEFVKAAYLEDPILYDKLAKYYPGGQFKRELDVYLLNKIFKENDLVNIDRDFLYKEIARISKKVK